MVTTRSRTGALPARATEPMIKKSSTAKQAASIQPDAKDYQEHDSHKLSLEELTDESLETDGESGTAVSEAEPGTESDDNEEEDEDASDDEKEVVNHAGVEVTKAIYGLDREPFEWDDFPGEVKNKVYRLLMRSHKQIEFEFADFKRMATLGKDFHLSGQMLACSKSICKEAQPILYGENIFRIHQNMHDFFGKKAEKRKLLILKIAISTRVASNIINKARKTEIRALKNLNEIIVDGGICKERLTDRSLDEQEKVVMKTFEEEDHRELKDLLSEHLDKQKTYLMTGQIETASSSSDGINKYAEFRFDIVSLGGTAFVLELATRRVYTIERKTALRVYLS